jgi:hypothetical protein
MKIQPQWVVTPGKQTTIDQVSHQWKNIEKTTMPLSYLISMFYVIGGKQAILT